MQWLHVNLVCSASAVLQNGFYVFFHIYYNIPHYKTIRC